ncbi:MAG: hypothetical protein RLZZ422_1594 [Pseudomonadota bacterium]|jgi:hypothetical protein
MYSLCTTSKTIIFNIDLSTGYLKLYSKSIDEPSCEELAYLGSFDSFNSAIKYLKNRNLDSIKLNSFELFKKILCEQFKAYQDNLYYFDTFESEVFTKKAVFIKEIYIERFSIEIFNLIKEFSLVDCQLLVDFVKLDISTDDKYYLSFIECKNFISSFDLI